MNRNLRIAAALSALLAAALGAGYAALHRGSTPVVAVASAAGGGSAGAPAGGSAAAGLDVAGKSSEPDPNYELEKLPILSRVVLSVKENYVDQRRVDPKAMVFAALDAVEKAVAEVMVDGDPRGSGKFTVTVGSAEKTFDASGVKTPWDARGVLADVMGFVKKHLVAHKDLRDIEYAAVNGLLSTLDPHSILLEPKMYREMRLATKGEFGGLGFVIAMRDGNLTVVRVLKNTPAQKAGIRAKDVIVRIEEQSTVNMDLQDAVDRLRGRPATRVSLTVSRAGWPEPRRLQLQREIIAVETVPQSKLLDGGVGYVKLSQFSANTTRDLVGAMNALRAQAGGNLKGLVLDLRGNPGGLLEQAIQVSDLFLSHGVIVKTVGEGMRMNEVKEATADRDDVVGLPLVVVVNNSSASASEIVAGALKNNDRALVIGRQTFGKGSVQVLYDFSDPSHPSEESALKLTIAQYLTPGDVSIQEVGVTPDVLLLPGRVLKDAVNFFAPPRMMGEADLERHFSNPTELSLSDAERDKRAKERENRTEKAPLELRYLLDEKEDKVAKQLAADEKREAMERLHNGVAAPELTPEQQEDDEADANPDEVVEDFQIRFGRELLSRATAPQRSKLLDDARALVAEKKKLEADRLAQKLAALGVDWSAGPAGGTPRAVVSVSPPPGKRAVAGDTVPWTVTVENSGDGAFRRLRAWTRVEKNALLDRREFVFGAVKPGQKRSWTVPVKLPKGTDTRHDSVTLQFADENGTAPQPVATALDVVETARPAFAFTAQVDDDAGGNGDGLVQRGEKLTLRVDVQNEGAGASGDKTYVSLKNLGDEKTFIEKGRQVLGTIAPGETKTALLTLEVKKGGKGDAAPVRVMIVDEKLDEYVADRIELPLRDARPSTPARGALRVSAPEAIVRAAAAADTAAVASARKGAVLPVVARYGDFYKVEWTKGRHGFVAASDGDLAGQGALSGAVAAAWQREPPRIQLTPDPANGAPIVQADKLHVDGVATVPQGVPGARTRLRDVFVFVNDQKVFFRVVPESGAARELKFAADLPLKPGNNAVTVFAREDEEFQSRRTFWVHRGPAAEVAQTK